MIVEVVVMAGDRGTVPRTEPQGVDLPQHSFHFHSGSSTAAMSSQGVPVFHGDFPQVAMSDTSVTSSVTRSRPPGRLGSVSHRVSRRSVLHGR